MEILFERAREGDHAAMEALVDSLRPRLERMARYYSRCTGEDPDDLLQEAWVGLLEALRVLDITIGNPAQFLIQRARWRLLDAVKRARVRRYDLLEDMPAFEAVDPSPQAPDAGVTLWEFTRKLTRTQQAVLHSLMAGLTWREAGQSLGCTSANVAYHVRKIRKLYTEWDSDSGRQGV